MAEQWLVSKIYRLFACLFPRASAVLFILNSRKIHPAYKLTDWRKLWLVYRMLLNQRKIPSASPYKTHLAMALKLFELSPHINGDVVECGTWKGGSAANLSLVCKMVGRQLVIFDSFAGLPSPKLGETQADYPVGTYAGTLEEVKDNIKKGGSLDNCEFIKGWFADTLPKFNRPVVLAFLDVDLVDNLHDCVRYLWPLLVDGGYIFSDECIGINYVSLFYSEKWWDKYLHTDPPGLIGAGTGLPLGDYYIGPHEELSDHPFQHASTGGYTYKGMSSKWTYYPNEINQEKTR